MTQSTATPESDLVQQKGPTQKEQTGSPASGTGGPEKIDMDAAAALQTTNRMGGTNLSSLASMSVVLDVRIPLHSFRFATLAALGPDSIVSSSWALAEDIPVMSGEVRLAWAEFAVAGQKRSVRITRIA